MKTRTGFVSNSSSSSFILDKTKMEPWQIEAVKNHVEYISEHYISKVFGNPSRDNEWELVDETDKHMEFFTPMDNLNLINFVRTICGSHDVFVTIEES